jgi:phosphoribosyl 1,2-cyclic phosphodiesterase
MSLFVASLNSGSNGNCYYVGNQDEAVLIDGGISCRETEKRMKRLGLSIKKVKAIFVSHEHGDHIHGVASLSKKHQLPVYITKDTLHHGKLTIREDRIFTLASDIAFPVGNLTVKAFPKFHDASDPYSFMVTGGTVNVGIFTDIGRPCENVIRHFSQCHAAFLESNYDEDMLENGGYPVALKNRIRGGRGHLSNRQALELFTTYRPSFMSHLFLSHLSRNNNKPKIVKDLFSPVAGHTEIIIASREKETKVYYIRSNLRSAGIARKPAGNGIHHQLSLFH